jgi:holliday junction DNA helicase RuvA
LIGRLVGRVVEDGADGTLILDVNGVGYEVTVPQGALGRAGADASGATTLYVHTHVREDAFVLFGFPSRDERSAFRELIGVSNIGPKIALSILGVLSPGELTGVVQRAETGRLVAVPGVGKKTAERIVLELKDKLRFLPAPSATAAPAAPRGEKGELLQGALTRMGFRAAEAERAVTALGARVESMPLGDLVREALALLAR